jgi:hypothetical protein
VTHRFALNGAGRRWAAGARRFGLTALQRRALGGLQRSDWGFLLSTPAAATLWSPLVGGPLLGGWGGEFSAAWVGPRSNTVDLRRPTHSHTPHAQPTRDISHAAGAQRMQKHTHARVAPRRMCTPARQTSSSIRPTGPGRDPRSGQFKEDKRRSSITRSVIRSIFPAPR